VISHGEEANVTKDAFQLLSEATAEQQANSLRPKKQ